MKLLFKSLFISLLFGLIISVGCNAQSSKELVIEHTIHEDILNKYKPADIKARLEQEIKGCFNATSVKVDVNNNGLQYVISARLPDDVREIDYYLDQYFSSNRTVTKVIIPEGIEILGFLAFEGCSSLTSIEIPNSVTAIGERAFEGCSSLTSIAVPNSVTTIGVDAFRDCSSLTGIAIPDSVTEIGSRAFGGCSSLTSIAIPDSVTEIGSGAFGGCSSLTSIEVSRDNPRYNSRSNSNAIIETSTNTLLFGCSKTIIPNSVTEIGSGAFEGCSSLTSIEIPNSVTEIGFGAFFDCSSLTSIEIPNSVTEIGEKAFCGCSSLTSIEISDSVTKIGYMAFFAESLKSVVIPNSLRIESNWGLPNSANIIRK